MEPNWTRRCCEKCVWQFWCIRSNLNKYRKHNMSDTCQGLNTHPTSAELSPTPYPPLSDHQLSLFTGLVLQPLRPWGKTSFETEALVQTWQSGLGFKLIWNLMSVMLQSPAQSRLQQGPDGQTREGESGKPPVIYFPLPTAPKIWAAFKSKVQHGR